MEQEPSWCERKMGKNKKAGKDHPDVTIQAAPPSGGSTGTWRLFPPGTT